MKPLYGRNGYILKFLTYITKCFLPPKLHIKWHIFSERNTWHYISSGTIYSRFSPNELIQQIGNASIPPVREYQLMESRIHTFSAVAPALWKFLPPDSSALQAYEDLILCLGLEPQLQFRLLIVLTTINCDTFLGCKNFNLYIYDEDLFCFLNLF